jgi:environmental stress-induced protein Ves
VSVRILRSRNYSVLPWKNSLGVSHVIASQPKGAGYDSAGWQVGTTNIEANCPFSDLPGLDRQFMLLEGDGVELHCRGANGAPDIRRRIDAPFAPFAFRGDWQTECRLLGGAVRVFNVVTRRGRFSVEVSVAPNGKPIALEKAADELLLAFVAEGAIHVEGCSVSLAMNDAMIVDGPKPERYSINGTTARMVIVRLTEVRQTAGQ